MGKGARARAREAAHRRDQGRRTARRAAVVTIVVLIGLAGGVWWLRAGPKETEGGTPRIAVDRGDIELGYLRFESPARVVFALRNDGDGPLRLREVPLVKAVAGC
jgi:hypothetical protein